jgi:hypothetical protein
MCSCVVAPWSAFQVLRDHRRRSIELSDVERNKRENLIKVVPTYGQPYYGSVSVELF